jgi:hypothetical protein
MDGTEIGVGTMLARAPGVALGELPEETVLLDIDGERAVRVNSAGAWIWGRLESPATLGELATAMASHFGIDEARATEDAIAFAAEMAARGLLKAG